MNIFEVKMPRGPRSSSRIGFFANRQVAERVAAAVVDDDGTSVGLVVPTAVNEATDYQAYEKEALIITALAKLTDADKEALGLAI